MSPDIRIAAPHCYTYRTESPLHSEFVGRPPATLEKRIPINLKNKLMKNNLLEERVMVLHNIISSTHDRYFSADINEGQKGLYETLLGAGIWYLPGNDALYSGRISEAALESLRNDPANTKLVEEHSFPRKVGGKYLFELFKQNPEGFTEEFLIE